MRRFTDHGPASISPEYIVILQPRSSWVKLSTSADHFILLHWDRHYHSQEQMEDPVLTYVYSSFLRRKK